MDCCATRLRCTVKDASLVNDGILKATGASGVVHKGLGVQVIYGPNVTVIKSNLEDYLETAPDTLETPAETSETAPEKPILVLDNHERSWHHHSCGIFTFQPDHWCSG
ncbi:MAG: hypothetical protein BHV91_03745 [Clostridiales bacterium 44_9]|nr:MAG: hypothetical protein BHV91_03745 [Clostridiales bacterium 44_9]